MNKNQTVDAEVPVHARYDEGNDVSPAERNSLIVLQQLETVEIKAVPSKLPDVLEYDGEKLINVGDHVTVADLTTTTNLETLSLVQQHVISVGNLGTTPTLETLDLILGGALTISDLATAPAFETVSLTPGLSIDGLTASTSLESITLLPDYILSVNDLSTTPVLGTVELVPHYVLSVSHLSTAPSLSEPGVVTVVTLILADLSLLPVFENTNLVQQSILSGVAELIATTHLQETTVSPEVAVANLATSPSLSAIPHLRDDYRLWKFEKTNQSKCL